jgi:hypothetical protein
MIRSRLVKSEFRWIAAVFALLILLAPVHAGGLRTVERSFPSYSHGVRSFTCLAIDGGIVPLCVPDDATLENQGELKIVWPKDRSFAVIRKATEAEISLLDQMDQPDGPKAWKDYLAAEIKKDSDQYELKDFQPGILAVNHWRIGAMTLDYSFSGVRSCILLLLWRTQDGTTIAVTMRTGFSEFKSHCEGLYQMIGGSMLVPEKPVDPTAGR